MKDRKMAWLYLVYVIALFVAVILSYLFFVAQKNIFAGASVDNKQIVFLQVAFSQFEIMLGLFGLVAIALLVNSIMLLREGSNESGTKP